MPVPAINISQNAVDDGGPYKGKSQAEVVRVKRILEKEWNGMSEEKINHRCTSFPRRLEQVRDNGGG